MLDGSIRIIKFFGQKMSHVSSDVRFFSPRGNDADSASEISICFMHSSRYIKPTNFGFFFVHPLTPFPPALNLPYEPCLQNLPAMQASLIQSLTGFDFLTPILCAERRPAEGTRGKTPNIVCTKEEKKPGVAHNVPCMAHTDWSTIGRQWP